MAAKKKLKSKKSLQKPLTTNQQQDESGGAALHASSKRPADAVFATAKAAKGEDLIYVSPSRVRFQHSRIRPFFSGCGRSVAETLELIRRGSLEPGELPPIQVLVGPDDNDGLGPWYFSLNNRRLWVLKQCHKEGLLDNEKYGNTIPARVRLPKSRAEAERYSVDNCTLDAKFIRESGRGESKSKKGKLKGKKEIVQCERHGNFDSVGNSLEIKDGLAIEAPNEPIHISTKRGEADNGGENSGINDASDSESESSDGIAHQNRFSALL